MEELKRATSIRERIRDLNAKSYYLLIALSFVFGIHSGSTLLKCSLTLTSFTAVLPVVDYVRSAFWLEIIRGVKVMGMVLALAFMIIWIWTPTAAP